MKGAHDLNVAWPRERGTGAPRDRRPAGGKALRVGPNQSTPCSGKGKDTGTNIGKGHIPKTVDQGDVTLNPSQFRCSKQLSG